MNRGKGKRLLSIIMMIIVTLSTVFSLVACTANSPKEFLKAFAEAKKYTIYTITPDGKTTGEVRYNNRNAYLYVPLFYDMYAIANDSGHDIYVNDKGKGNYIIMKGREQEFWKTVNNMKTKIIKEFVPNYEKGAINKSNLKGLFQKKNGKWYKLDSEGNINAEYGFIRMEKSAFHAYDADGVLRYTVTLSCDRIRVPISD